MSFAQRWQEVRTGFQPAFWVANFTELFERLAYYGPQAVFAIYLHARVTYGWREKRAAIITAFGFAAILFTLYAVNLWIAGLHSYARA